MIQTGDSPPPERKGGTKERMDSSDISEMEIVSRKVSPSHSQAMMGHYERTASVLHLPLLLAGRRQSPAARLQPAQSQALRWVFAGSERAA